MTGATSANFHYEFATAGNHDVVVEVKRNGTNGADCTGFDTTTVKVSAVPEIVVAITLPDTICNGQTVTVGVTTTPGIDNEEYTYTWYRNGEILNGVTGTTFTDDPVNNSSNIAKVIYGVTATQASSGCQSITKYDTLYIQPAPEVHITGTPLVCFEDTVRLTVNVEAGYTPTEYAWYKDNADMSVNDSEYKEAAASRAYPYIYKAVVTYRPGCTVETEPFYVYVNDSINAQITHNQDSICAGRLFRIKCFRKACL